MRRSLAAWVIAACCTGGAATLHAQLPADAGWQTLESRHFRVTWHAGLEALARRAAVSAERAHAALSVMVAEPPRGTIDIVVSDNVDFSNGYATPFPSPRIVVYARPPVDMLELQYMHDWIDLVVTHELAHIFHLEVAGGFGRLVRSIFGRVPAPWPLFPAVGTPAWSVEGLAVGIESALGGHGRIHGSYHEMVVRTAALEGSIDEIERLESTSPVWPGPVRAYIYGSLFMDYLTRRYGPEAAARIVRSTAGAIIPPPLWFDAVARSALGVSFRAAYEAWQRELETRYTALAAALTEAGLTSGRPLTAHGGFATYPRFSPDGSMIAYAASDGRTASATRVIDAATGEEVWRRRRNTLAASAWLPDGALVTSELEYVDRFRVFTDLHVSRPGGDARLTRRARLQDPHVARDGSRIVAVQNGQGTNRLVLVAVPGGEERALTGFDPDVHWTLPRLSPDGRLIAAGRWRTGGTFDVVLLDSAGRVVREVAGGPGITDAPAWSPDGRWLLFWSDRSGIPNIYAADVRATAAQPPLRQVTNVLTGAYYPDVSPDGRWIAYARYHADGFSIELLPFDPASWRDPAAVDGAVVAAHTSRDAYETEPQAAAFADSVRTAVARADTTAGPPRPYRALRHLRPYAWLPTIATETNGPTFLGVAFYGRDLVERHDWTAGFAIDPSSGRSEASLGWTFRGLPTIPGLGVHVAPGLAVQRDWDVVFRDAAGRRIEEREDIGAVVLGLSRARFRTRLAGSISAEAVRRSAHLAGTGWDPAARLRDPVDDLLGIRATASLATFITPRFAISRENGVVLQAAARQRWDRSVSESIIDDATVVFDGGYRELTTWNAAYLALPLPGFARHALAVRASGLLRDGPGAGTSSIGGVSGGFALPGFPWDVLGTGRLLPVRGYDSGVRRGTRAWTASAEYRAPVALLTRAVPPLPLFFDRLAAAAFLDAGHAWCTGPDAARLPDGACASTRAVDPPLVAAGAEVLTILSAWGVPLPLRFGAGVPLSGGDGVRFHLTLGSFF